MACLYLSFLFIGWRAGVGGGSKVVVAACLLDHQTWTDVVVIVAAHLLLMLTLIWLLLALPSLLVLLLMMSLFVVNGRLWDGPAEWTVHRRRRKAQQWIQDVVQTGRLSFRSLLGQQQLLLCRAVISFLRSRQRRGDSSITQPWTTTQHQGSN